MKVIMAGSAEHQRLATTCSHDFDPERLFPAIIAFQVFECPNMMNFNLLCPGGGLTDFADLCQESLFQFGSAAPFPRWLVLDGCLNIPGECNPAPC